VTSRTKLVCTLGPASATPKMVRGLVEAGATVFRVNVSHGTAEEHERAIGIVRGAERDTGRVLAVLADLPGPKVRLGDVRPDPLRLHPGQSFVLRSRGPGDASGASTTYPGLAGDLRRGDRVLLADGAVELTVTSIDGADVVTECVRGGIVRSRQGVNVPAERLGLPAVTERDREALERMLSLRVDLVAQSFVRDPQDIAELRSLMGERAVPIVAKIETKPAVDRIEGILEVTDALMVARGDLGVELPMEEVPLLQKDLMRAARAVGRPAVVATQMLESMIRAPRPTRAEATDVANAVLDGADAVMLSGETRSASTPSRPPPPQPGSRRPPSRGAWSTAARNRGVSTGRRRPPSPMRPPRSRRATRTSPPSPATRRPAGRRGSSPSSDRASRSWRSSPIRSRVARTRCSGV
jgi:pyruvate kinase